MKYYFLKLGRGNNEAEARLSGNRPNAAVYFDDKSEKTYERGIGKLKARLFWEVGKKAKTEQAVMVVIYKANVWLLLPTGRVKFGKRFKTSDGWLVTPKVMPIQILAKVPSKNVPPVLASMGCSQAYGRRTFTRIGHWGNLKAIDSTLQRFGKQTSHRWVPSGIEPDSDVEEHWRKIDSDGKPNQEPAQLLECLGSTEFETLVAKLLESRGCHVPAHCGGTLGDIDLFAWNNSKSVINLDGLKIPSSGRISIQVKTHAWGMTRPKTVDYLIGIGVKGQCAFNEYWLLKQIKKNPAVLQWMLRSLDWLPEWFLKLDQIACSVKS
jgi:hypothetical protein